MKVKIFFILCTLALILVPVVTAMETSVTVHTVPGYKAMIRFLNPDYEYSSVLESFHYTANTNGDIIFTYETSRDDFDMDIWLTLEGEKMGNKRFDETFDTGFAIDVEFYPSWYTPPVKETPEVNGTNETEEAVVETIATETEEAIEEVTQIEEVKADKERVTAFSVQDGKVAISPKGFLYIFGLVILAILIFIGIKHTHHIEKKIKEVKEGRGSKKKEIKIRKMSEMNKNKSGRLKDQEEKIEKAKEMIEEAQEEINKMKNPNQNKIDEIKKRLIEDEKELMRLRKDARDIN